MIDAGQTVELFLSEFPQLASPIMDFEDDWKANGSGAESDFGLHILFGDVIFPLAVEPMFHSETVDIEGLKRFWDLIERIAVEGDAYVHNFVWTSVCERVGDDPRWLSLSRQLMGPLTQQLSDHAEKRIGRG